MIFINQIRMKIGVMFGSPFCGLKFYASVRLDIRRTGAVKEKNEIIGNETRIKVVKNKIAPRLKRGIRKSYTAKASTLKVNLLT